MNIKGVFSFGALFLASTLSLTACSGEDGVNGADGKDAAEIDVDSLAKAIRDDISEKLMDSLYNVDDDNNGKDGANGKDGSNGKDGKDGKDAKEVNVDSLAKVIREDISKKFMDSLSKKPYIDSIYNELFDNTLGDTWMDSLRTAFVDSLNAANYDSLYNALYDSIYNDIYTQNAIRTLDAWVWSKKENIYGAFANQYPLMYKDFKNDVGESHPVPISIVARNTCDNSPSSTTPCRWKKVTLKAWIEGATDTSTSTQIVNPDTTVIIDASLKFDTDYLNKLTTPKQEHIQVRAYANENDREIPFFSESVPTTIHPMQINGAEYAGVENRDWWDGVWVTPNMDSITTILAEVAKKLPGGVLKVYQKYEGDEDLVESSERVVKAVFEVLQSRNIKYIENDNAGSHGQKVNYPIEVLRTKQGVCNELSFLFASILEAVGFNVLLIKIPSHMFIGWESEKDGPIDLVETTMITDKNNTFESANSIAIETYKEQVTTEALASGDAEITELSKVREYGILPNDIP